jgi:hypothetical protein
MSKQTINIGASPNDGTGTPLRTSFDYCNLNFTELYTAVGPSGNNIVVPGNATITGDLTVRTNKLFVNATGVGIGNAGPLSALTVSSQTDARLSVRTTEAVFGTITGGTALDSLNDAASALVPFGCRGSTVSFAASGQTVGLQLDASSNVNVPLGNVVMGTSGKGIDFSAVTGGTGTATANVLNDYEEGTWVPVIGGSSGTSGQTYGTPRLGRYTKIGRQVTCTFEVALTAVGTITGYPAILGLPFVPTSSNIDAGSVSIGIAVNFFVTLTNVSGYIAGAASFVWLTGNYAASSSPISNLAVSDITNTTRLVGTITYFA